MSSNKTYYAENVNASIDEEINRLRQQVELSWEKEKQKLSGFGLKDGMSVLELGCGPGFFTEKLLSWLPNSQFTALDTDPMMISIYMQQLQEKAANRLAIRQASILDTGLAENCFDFVVIRFVFWSLPEPDQESAAIEIMRLLKPSGKVVITDFDSDFYFFVDTHIPRHELFNEKMQQKISLMDGSYHTGRHLPRVLKQGGFGKIELEAILMHSDLHDKSVLLNISQDEKYILRLLDDELISEAEFNEMKSIKAKILEDSSTIVIVTYFMCCGQK